MLLDKLLNLTVDARNLGDLINVRSLLLILVEHGLNQELEVATGALGKRLALLVDNHVKYCFYAFAIERLLKSDELIDNNSHGPHVCFCIVSLSFANLGRHEVGGSTFRLGKVVHTSQSL